MTSDPVQEIKERLDIVDVIKEYIKLEKAGSNYRAQCPFHSEKNPSFFVSPSRQIFHCFGCGEGGDMFEFIKKIEGVEFGDALKILADRAGVELKEQDPRMKTKRNKMQEICELSCQFFEKQLEGSSKGKKAKKYLKGRGISEESIERWRLGYAPDQWRSLLNFLSNKGFKTKNIVKAGLVIKKQDGKTYDRFRGRIMFPVFNLNGEVIGFGGRVFEQDKTAKYMNTPNTLLYDKSKVLYGLDKAKVAIRKKDQAILVEGYTDVILASQVGYENVVATSGTALTSKQLKILKRYSDNLLVAFDMDVAGSTATRRGIDMAQEQGFNIKVVSMPEDSDPADIVSEDEEQWESLVENADSIMEFYIKNAFSQFNDETPEGKEKISNRVLPAIKRIPNEITKAHWIQELSDRLGVDEESIKRELGKIEVEQEQDEEEEEKEEKSREEKLEERVLALILQDPSLIRKVKSEHLDHFTDKSRKILKAIEKNVSEEEVVEEIKKELEGDAIEHLDYLALKSDVMEEEKLEEEVEVCLKELCSSSVKEQLNKIANAIKKAEKKGDKEKVEKLVNKFNNLAQDLNSL
ncbi:MAG: DNA primase [Candidatus Paceibacterota bacterium]